MKLFSGSSALPSTFKEPFSNILNPSKETKNSSDNLQQLDLNPSSSSPVILNTIDSTVPVEKPKIVLKNSKPSCSHYEDNMTSVQIKTEPDTMNIFSQGTYRNEEDSVIVIYSSDEENNMKENGLEIPNIKIEQEENIHSSTMSTRNAHLNMSKREQSSNIPVWSMHCQVNDIVSDDEDDIIYIPPQSNLNSINNDNDLTSSSDSDSKCNSKFSKIINPLPMMSNRNNNKKQTKLLTENRNILKTRAKSEKKINNKKKTEEFTVEQNKKIIQERRLKLQQLTKNKSSFSSTEKITLNENPSAVEYIDTPSTTSRLKKKTRISRFQQNSNLSCIPSTSKSFLATKVKENKDTKTNNKTEFNSHGLISHLDSRILEHSSRKSFISVNRTYFETLSKICKWNAVWLRVS